jgi:phosphosulfolactate phosphohydrolase-like enzyme
MATKRVVTTDPVLEAEVARHKEELRICGERRRANIDKMQALATDATPVRGMPILVEKVNGHAAHLNGTNGTNGVHDSHKGENLAQSVRDSGEKRKGVIAKLKETACRVVNDLPTPSRFALDGGPTTV